MSNPISSTELSRIRTAFSLLRPVTASIVEDTLASDGAGGQTETPVTIAEEACRITAMNLARPETQFAGRFRDTIPYQITLPYDSVVEEKHRIEAGGDTYEVVAVWGAGTFGHEVKAICMKVT